MRERRMTREEAARILDAVIPPPEHHTVDLDHLRIAQAWACIKEALKAEPVKHGRWSRERLPSTGGGSYEVFRCNLCNEAFNWRTAYCPNCGAKMDEVEE